jgi:hypothetical protein
MTEILQDVETSLLRVVNEVLQRIRSDADVAFRSRQPAPINPAENQQTLAALERLQSRISAEKQSHSNVVARVEEACRV